MQETKCLNVIFCFKINNCILPHHVVTALVLSGPTLSLYELIDTSFFFLRLVRSHGHTCDELFDLRRGKFSKRLPDVVVFPRKHDDVVKIVNSAAMNNVCLIPIGGGKYLMRNCISNCFLNISERNNYRLNFDIMLLGGCACISVSGESGEKCPKSGRFLLARKRLWMFSLNSQNKVFRRCPNF